jgi:hypothetical protein
VKVRFLPAAAAELDEAVAHYNGLAPGLGGELAMEVRQGLRRIKEFPDAWHKLGPRVRRYRLKRFPYGIVYASLPSQVAVIAFMNLRRKPGYWKKRLRQV